MKTNNADSGTQIQDFRQKTWQKDLFFRSRGPRLGGDDGWKNQHSDKSQADEQILHSGSPWEASYEPFHIWMITRMTISSHPTKTDSAAKPVGWFCPKGGMPTPVGKEL